MSLKKTISLNYIFASKENKDYFNAINEIKNYYCLGKVETYAISKKYKKALENYRLFLDRNGIRLPPIKYPIFKNYKNTFKYLDAIIKDNYGRFEFVQMIHNPNWIYKKMDLKNNNNQ